MIQSTPAERYPKVSYMRPGGTMEYYTDQTNRQNDRYMCSDHEDVPMVMLKQV
jgi:hypothetical protein